VAGISVFKVSSIVELPEASVPDGRPFERTGATASDRDPKCTGSTIAIIAVPLSIDDPEGFVVMIAMRYESIDDGFVIFTSPFTPCVARAPAVTLTTSPAAIPLVELSVTVIELAPPDTTVTPSFVAFAEDERSLSINGPPEETAKSTSV